MPRPWADRFDSKTRLATAIIFLIQRGLGVGLALYAPAVVFLLAAAILWLRRTGIATKDPAIASLS